MPSVSVSESPACFFLFHRTLSGKKILLIETPN